LISEKPSRDVKRLLEKAKKDRESELTKTSIDQQLSDFETGNTVDNSQDRPSFHRISLEKICLDTMEVLARIDFDTMCESKFALYVIFYDRRYVCTSIHNLT